MKNKFISYPLTLINAWRSDYQARKNYLLDTYASKILLECKVCGKNDFHDISLIPNEEINRIIDKSFLFKGDARLKVLYDYSSGQGVKLCNCKGCNSLTTVEEIQKDRINDFYSYLYGNYDHYSGEKWEFSKVLDYLKGREKGGLLEFGSGNGNFISKLVERSGYEISDVVGYDFGVGDDGLNIHSIDLSSEVIKPDKKYQNVVSFNFLEHLQKYEAFFKSLKAVTEQDSVVIVSVPARYFSSVVFNSYSVLELPPHHVTHFSIDGMKKLFKSNGFDCFDCIQEKEELFSKKYIFQFVSHMFSYLSITAKTKKKISKDYSKKSVLYYFKKTK
jgi:hypothetical protein